MRRVGWGRRGAIALAWTVVLGAAGCHRDESPPSGDPPAPSAFPTGVALGLELRGCAGGNDACERDCEAGVGDRCRSLALTLRRGPLEQRDEAKATALYERGCDLGDLPSCVFAGQMYEYHHGVPEDDAAAARFYGRACDKGWSAGCYNLAIMFDNGRGVARDPARAASLYEGACKAGAKPACDRVTALRAEIEGGRADSVDAESDAQPAR
jgi:TPR repeat protein